MFCLNFVNLRIMKTVIKNISKLVQTEVNDIKWKAGNDMNSVNTIDDAYIEIKDGIITDFGNMNKWKGISDWNQTTIIDAEDGMVFPTYCDSHTHLVFPESRENEFNVSA